MTDELGPGKTRSAFLPLPDILNVEGHIVPKTDSASDLVLTRPRGLQICTWIASVTDQNDSTKALKIKAPTFCSTEQTPKPFRAMQGADDQFFHLEQTLNALKVIVSKDLDVNEDLLDGNFDSHRSSDCKDNLTAILFLR